MKCYTWAELPETPLPAEVGTILRQFVGGEEMTIARITFAAGSSLPAHRHVNEQFTIVLEGTMEFTVEGETIIVEAGQTIHLKSNEFHGAKSLTEATLLDIFAPPRADWGPPPTT